MNKKQTIDILIVVMGVAIALISYFYLEGSHHWLFFLLGAGIALLFFIWVLKDRRPKTAHYLSLPTVSQPPKAEVTEVVLLNDENQPLATWTLYGKISMVIGRDVGENQVNINLNNSTYASMIEVEHAVLNYSAGCWYVEDLASKNGVMVQKCADGRKYKLAPNQSCKLTAGDILYIGLARLQLR